jgi:hypothetical protein
MISIRTKEDEMSLFDDGTVEERRAEMRLKIAQALMGQSIGGGPVQSPLQGLARMAGGALGAWQGRQAIADLDRQDNQTWDEMAHSLGGRTLPDPAVAGPRTGSGTFEPATRRSVSRQWLQSDNPILRRAGASLFRR